MNGNEQLRTIIAHADALIPAWRDYVAAAGLSTQEARWHSVYVWLVEPCMVPEHHAEDWGEQYLIHPCRGWVVDREYAFRPGNNDLPAANRLSDVLARVLRAIGIEPHLHPVYGALGGVVGVMARPATLSAGGAQ
jgi:hypothetical protein